MATINEHVSALRTLIKEHSDDTIYDSQFLYRLLLNARSHLLQREYSEGKAPDPQEFNTLCLCLEPAELIDCGDCIPAAECQIMKSVSELPTIIATRFGLMSKVGTLDGRSISLRSRSNSKYAKYSRVGNKASYWFVNKKLVLQNSSILKVVLLEAVFEDPTDLALINNCDSTGSLIDDPCFDVTSSDFPIRAHLVQSMYKLAIDALGVTLRLQEDQKNDSNDTNISAR